MKGFLMEYEIQLQFVQNLFKKMYISSHIATTPDKHISTKIDLELRATLFGIQNYSNYLQNSMSDAAPNTIYRFFDEYFCNYIFLRLPDEARESYFYIGPYLSSLPSDDQIRKKAEGIGCNTEQRQFLSEYYQHLPIVEDENLLFIISNTLGDTLWGSNDNYSIEYIEYMIPDRLEPIYVTPSYGESKDASLSLSSLEQNYANEHFLMEAVSQGKLHKLNAVTSVVYTNGTENRLADSLRNRKNYLIILNTLLRKAAEQGGVHPLHIDRLSSHFAKKIEEVYSIDYSLYLQSDMIRQYCLLVKQHSLKQYSDLIGKTITLISFDLTADLSLKNISTQLNVNPTYLSALFHKECNCTLTEYVNTKRIEHAIHLLAKSHKQINVIAFECGIQDTNYFIKLFKKHTGLTPTQYRDTMLST